MTGAQFVEVMLQPKLDKLMARQKYEAMVRSRVPDGMLVMQHKAAAATSYYEDTHQLAQELYAILACWAPLVVRAPARALLTFRECATLDIAAGTPESQIVAVTAKNACEATLAWLAKERELGDENAAAEDPGGPNAAAGLGLHPE